METPKSKIAASNMKTKRKHNSSRKWLAHWLLDNQISIPFNLIATVIILHLLLPSARPYTTKFFTLSYYNPNIGKYAAGHDDFYFITFCIVLFTGIRASLMKYVLASLAKLRGISKEKGVTRFCEQGWILSYYTVLWPLGLYIYCKSPYFLNMEKLWTDWPQRELDGLMKAYILAQWSYCIQEVFIINIEDRRKDHWQMLTHHFVTISLIASCYAYHQTRVGSLILMLMDIIDVFLPLAKCLKYLGFTTLCDIVFGLFIFLWLLTRHIFYLMICWSIYHDLPRLIVPACYKGTGDNLQGPFPVPKTGWSHLLEPFRDPVGIVCFNGGIAFGFLACLLFLQLIMITWFVLIVRIALRILRGDNAEDIRSDAESEGEEDSGYRQVQSFEEGVGARAVNVEEWRGRSGTGGDVAISSISLPGHIHLRERLNRIGCERKLTDDA
ncbi:TLC domain-containing protein [Xylogone sp. PMI_703]|nr:TLC domain-containing protein [Xylogone sp. PMI_703]